ncbi:uncharacterized protein B0I36DRAFT_317139 [Microdochium trichocladiopsis]|uniref:Uncharacterized protein n=1 Tax=Microdochium trichocladiopsis TaxID=1682393 RepID=A0A9P9BSJ5_9PEZI|nr:uncharacterized protein B0I36DRAFT_317139 [Microdochium trichocladiopsis]KAH7034875.1 hypothetical protein B0I36DRAFT_317139 [Microdochium trichocladiopsis]
MAFFMHWMHSYVLIKIAFALAWSAGSAEIFTTPDGMLHWCPNSAKPQRTSFMATNNVDCRTQEARERLPALGSVDDSRLKGTLQLVHREIDNTSAGLR